MKFWLQTVTELAQWKCGQFERAKLTFKTIPVSWAENMLTTDSNSFQRGTVTLCRLKGCKVTVHQTLRMIKIVRDSNPGCRQLVTLKLFDIQRPTVPLWKDLEPVVNILFAQETGCILKISFALSKRPYLRRAYVVTVCRVLSTTVSVSNQKQQFLCAF